MSEEAPPPKKPSFLSKLSFKGKEPLFFRKPKQTEQQLPEKKEEQAPKTVEQQEQKPPEKENEQVPKTEEQKPPEKENEQVPKTEEQQEQKPPEKEEEQAPKTEEQEKENEQAPKTEEKEDDQAKSYSQEKISAFRNAAAAFIADIKATNGFVVVCVLLSFFFTIVATIIAVIFILSAFQKLSRSFLITNPINEAALDYRVAISISSLLPKGYNYIYFLILPWLQFLPLVAIGIYYRRYSEDAEFVANFRIGQVFMLLLVLLGIHSIVCIIFNYIVYFSAYRAIRLVSQRINSFNNYIYARMYKGIKGSVDRTAAPAAPAQASESDKKYGKASGKSADFYKELNTVQVNPISVKLAAQKSLLKLPATIGVDDLAKAMFTANLYIHYHKIGVRNPSILDAIDLFKPRRLLLRMTFNPADYLFRRSTFIDDMSETFGSSSSSFLRPEIIAKNDLITSAIAKNAEWIAEANNQANNIFPEDTMFPFFQMAILMLFVQVFVPMVIYQILREPNRRSKIFGFLTRMLMGGTVGI